ncbi:phosphofurin acidic cluster sorting protein 2-like isoform X2 [Amphiura filiformis]|uniref:phosphofurin acidic cluster sorting protein 2-like isoform X2 n=1 Tax=Amphiura filiformis TaxID=82378 RepID=UPI003B213100
MAERLVGRVGQVGAGKPVPMKLFATWEVERTAPNCIPRLCSLKLARIVVLKPLEESDLNSILIAVRMQNSKRTLRSNEIFLPQGTLLDTELDLSFSLQYPHFLKRGNKLRVMLQRRKRYKNRTILGYKTLAVGLINMSEVLQQSKDSELSLFGKEQGRARVAQVTVLGLSSQPVDQFKRGMGRSIDIDMGSEEEEESYSSNDDNSDSGENLAETQMYTQAPVRSGRKRRLRKKATRTELWNDLLGEPEEETETSRKSSRNKLRQPINRQRNFKQKFISLLKKFKVQSDESDPEHFAFEDQDPNPIDEDFLYDDLDDLNLSDSGPEMEPDDEISIGSTPKPQLRPFFSQGIPTSSSMADDMEQGIEQNGDENGALCRDSESSDDIPPIDDIPIRKEVLTVRSDSVLSNISDPGGGKSSNLPPNPERSFSASSALQMQKENKRTHKGGRISREGSLGKEGQAGSTTCKPSKSLEKMGSFGKADNVPQLSTPVTEQLLDVWSRDDCIPERIALISIQERHGKVLCKCLRNSGNKVVQTATSSDVEASLQFIVNKLQKFCNLNPKLSSPLKVALCGSETYVGTVLRPYVEQLSTKSPDWQNYIKFYVVPVGSNSLAKYLGSVDNKYYTLFMDASWRDFFDKTDRDPSDAKDIASRVVRYMKGGSSCLQLPIGEVMLTCKLKSMDEEWVQKFVPFINNVRIGPSLEREGAFSSYSLSEQDEIVSTPSNSQLSSSPPAGNAGNNLFTGAKEKGSAEPLLTSGGTPPPSPAITNATATVQPRRDNEPDMFYASAPLAGELYDLQVEYWPMSGGKKDKTSLKTAFRSLTVHRLPGTGDPAINGLSMEVVTKEKNKKIMRIGKKQREVEPLKTQVIDGIHRLVCTSKSQDCSLKVTIDGIELPRVKFFQLSAQWQTHIKQFPVAVFGHNDMS